MIEQNQTVAQVAAGSLAAIRVFQKHGIDFCCGGQRSIEDVCRERGLEAGELVAELEQAIAQPAQDAQNWSEASLRDLMSHIVTRHHEYLRSELPRLQGWLDRVSAKYGEQDAATVGQLPPIFAALREELESHLQKEEMILFPAIARLEAAREAGTPPPSFHCGTLNGPIHVMEMEHESAGSALSAMREVMRNYEVPEHACRTYRALIEGLVDLEQDLHLHIHLENNILHVRTRALMEQPAVAAS
jgi:regulator of cell morphogenesis and NO signaling